MQTFTNDIKDQNYRSYISKLLNQSFNYLKLQYERHCDWDAPCPSHCIKYALSSAKDQDFLESCNQGHSIVCKDCFNLMESIELLKKELQKIFDKRNREYKVFETDNCLSKIFSWQQHIIRGSQQDKAKSDAMKNLHSSQALWIRDWAQKVLPGSGLEAQDVRNLIKEVFSYKFLLIY